MNVHDAKSIAPGPSPLLQVKGVTLQYKTEQHLVTATYRVSFDVYGADRLEIPAVFAGLFTVILIGLTVENLIFRNIEAATVRRWGMQT